MPLKTGCCRSTVMRRADTPTSPACGAVSDVASDRPFTRLLHTVRVRHTPSMTRNDGDYEVIGVHVVDSSAV